MLISQKRIPFQGLIDHHLRVGDTEFYVPPTSISIHRQMKNKKMPVLRARNSLPKESGYFDRVIEFTLFFPNRDSINNELRSLLAQVKKCPFLPVENTYLNDIHKIEAVTISGITVQTTPGFPNTLLAQIQCYAFEPFSYIAIDDDTTYDEMFNWPLFRWYYQRNLDPDAGDLFHTFYEPLYGDLDDSFKFRVAAEDDLESIAQWKKEKKELIKQYINEKSDNIFFNKEREKKFNEKYDKMYEKAMFEYDLHYEDWDIPGLILTDFSIGFENAITSLQLQDDASPTHQYLGSQDTTLVAQFRTNNEESIASLESLMHRSAHLIRTYHKEVANGFLEFDHQLARLFGVKNVTIEDVHTSTVEGLPGTYDVTLTMTAYNRAEKKLNEVHWLSETAEWNIDKWEEQGFLSLLTSLNPMHWDFGIGSKDRQASDVIMNAPFISPIARWSRFAADRPVFEQVFKGLNTFLKGHTKTAANLDDEGIQSAVYNEAVKQFFRAAEVYPDLELPTYGEVALAGFDIPNTNNGLFVEPDFFINYKKGTLFYEQLLESIKQDYKTILRDGAGGSATIQEGKIIDKNSVTKKETEKAQKDFEQAVQRGGGANDPIVDSLVDKGNISKSDMEALIRKKAREYSIHQSFPVAFAKVMDSDLKQFYEKGINAKQGKVVSARSGAPIMMNGNFKFYTNVNGSIDGEYIGVMKVRRAYGSNINMLGLNIEYNVETGIRKMSDFYNELERIFANSLSGGRKLYNEKNVYGAFGLKYGGNSFERDKARFAGVLMLYLGLESEYTNLIKNNKKPPSRIVNLIKSILKEASYKDQWSQDRINSETKRLPIKDFKSIGIQSASSKENTSAKFLDDDNKIHQGMMHDMLRYDKRGRLVRAFPTFFMTFIDEGQFVGTVKLSDQFFQYKAVMDIMYTNSRKEASSTLVLEMANIYGTLDDAEKGMDLAHTGISEVFKTMTMPGAVAREAERSRHRHPNYYKSIMLRTGTRIHFRMGYGSNPMEMPTIMNGTITSIQNNDESITVIAQDDGIELTNKIRADVNETTNGGFLFSKKEPTEIVDEILTDSNGFFKNMWAGLSNKEFKNHSLGIMHFGSQGEPQGWGEMKSFFGGVAAGATGGFLVGGPIGAVSGALGAGLFSSVAFGRDTRPKSEINLNVYQTTGLTNEEHDKWWNKVKDAFGIGQADEPGINIGLYDKTVWDVLNISASIGDDHVVAVHPFGFRNTIFSGKTYFPLHYDYVVEGEKVKGTAVKPFRQFHIYDSTTSIIDNSIQTTEENVRTVAVGVYMNEGEMDTTSPIYVDTNIWPEKQRVVNIDTTMNAQGVRLIQGIPLVGGLLNKPMKWHFDEGVAIKIAARGLSDYVRDMYDGYLTVMGDPSAKPYDQAFIFDSYNSIVGPADMKEVTHIMNHSVGFITMIKPDAVVVNSDQKAMNLTMTAQHMLGSALITHALQKKLKNSKYAGNLPILNSLWAATTNAYDRMKERFNASRVTGKLRDTLTGKVPKAQEKIKQTITNRHQVGAKSADMARWAKNGMLKKLEKLTGTNSRNNFDKLLTGSKRFGFSLNERLKLKENAKGLMTKGGKNLRKILKGTGSLARVLWGGAHIAAGPIGWLAFAIEAMVIHLITSTVAEFIERWLFMRQACLIAPLTKQGMEFTAGINGHKGSVVGDSPDFWQKVLTNKYSALLLGFIGVDAQKYSQENRGFSSSSSSSSNSSSKIDMNKLVSDFIGQYKVPIRNDKQIGVLYEEDRKAALEQINKRLELLGSRATKAIYDPEEKSWSDWIKTIGDKIKGWFTSLFDKVKSFFGSKDDGSVCIPIGDVPTSGKAKGLSKYFKVIGPKIEAEAKKQGIPQYAEILKAKCMQESGGNYNRYPDVMQASESLGKPVGYIKDVDASITQGVKYFGQIIKRCNGDIKLALQSYNFGTGFIDYAKKRGGKYTQKLAYDFASYMVKKLGRKISRIPPGYGDPKYVDRVLRYYDGDLPSGECENGAGTGGASSCPSATGAKGKKKYQTRGAGLTDLKAYKGKNFGITIVGGTSRVRPGTAEALVNAAKYYKQATGKTFNITSGHRPGDPNWHGTGWAVDIDTPNTMRRINGKMRFPNGKTKNEARALCQACIESGFRALYFGDWDIVQEMNKKYGAGTMTYEPAGHWNHLHCSYPICRK